MTATANQTPLLDGPLRSIALAVVGLVLVLITLDGMLTWIDAADAQGVIDGVVASNEERYPTGIDDTGLLLAQSDREIVAENTDGNRLDRDTITTKTWLAVIGLIAATALTISSGPGSSRNVLAAMIVIAAAAFFVPLWFYADTIDVVTTVNS